MAGYLYLAFLFDNNNNNSNNNKEECYPNQNN